MKFPAGIFLLFIFTFFGGATVSAQLKGPPAPAIPTKIVGKAKIYEFKTRTTGESVFLNRNDKQIIRAAYDIPAERSGKGPKEWQMLFQSFSDSGLKYEKDRKIVILLDDRKIAETDSQILMASCHRTKKNECYEVLKTSPLPFADFEAMLKAKNIKIKFGDTVFELTAEELAGLRDLQQTLVVKN